MLRVGVVGSAELAGAAAGTLRRNGVDVVTTPSAPVALTLAVVLPGGAADGAADAVVRAGSGEEAATAADHLHRSRLAPWLRALSADRPDVTGAPHLLPHDPGWAAVAARRAGALRQALHLLDQDDDLGLGRIDHIGSTAVPGLAAKPFLDLQVTLDRLPGASVLAAALAPLGWAPAAGARPDSPGVSRDARTDDAAPDEVFVKRLLVAPDPVRPAILHVRLTASPFARRVVRFRDLLRTEPDVRSGYEQMKHRAAAAHATDADHDDYTRAKGSWLAAVVARLDTAADPWPLDPPVTSPTAG